MNFVCSQIETCGGADAVYAYFRQEPTEADWEEALASEQEGNPDEAWEDREEVPTALTEAMQLKRYYMGRVG